ncbi:hypothetical protein E4U42_006902 [Claviceps africana]|uniref:Ysc84 actin-binding domain-containing protein n=1 Tax=Claviceps africana TaxID=83212 RepID=A0A8K0JB03_9HYPO|nr:hypothetical protein E4U42_006902 [Claviceps africana]
MTLVTLIRPQPTNSALQLGPATRPCNSALQLGPAALEPNVPMIWILGSRDVGARVGSPGGRPSIDEDLKTPQALQALRALRALQALQALMSDAGKPDTGGGASADLAVNMSDLQRQTQNPNQSGVRGHQPFPQQQDIVQYGTQDQQPHVPPPLYEKNQPSSHLSSGQQTAPPIPAHSPADATVAVPVAEVGTSGSHTQLPSPSRGQSQPALPEHAATGHLQDRTGVKHEHKSSTWGGRFKSMLAAGAVAPINSLAHKLGSQSFLPEPLDKECNKAALILRAFCTKGVYADSRFGQPSPSTSTDPQAKESSDGLTDPTKAKPKNRLLVTIPPKVIAKAVGLAIFTTFRAGFQISGATGSGILIARLPDGSWGPPSGISVHSLGGGFQIGVDIYDCICVINSREALSAFTNTRVSLGSDLAVAAGPYGAGGAVDFGTAVQRGRRHDADKQPAPAKDADSQAKASAAPEQEAQQSDAHAHAPTPSGGGSRSRRRSSRSASALKPVFSYVKSRGFYAGVQVDGTVVVERKDANSAFYGAAVTVQQILQGQVPPQGPNNMWPAGARELMETLRGAEGGALIHHPRQHQQQPTHAEQSEVGRQAAAAPAAPAPAAGAALASSASTENVSANSGLRDNVCTDGSHTDRPRSHTIGTEAGPAHHPLAGDASSTPPGHVDDGSHTHVSGAK